MMCEFVGSLNWKLDRRKALVVEALMAVVVILVSGARLAGASSAPALVVTTQTTVSSTAALPIQGIMGNIAVNKFGDVFVATNAAEYSPGSVVIEFPANGAAPISIFSNNPAATASYNGYIPLQQYLGLAIDANQSLYIVSRFGIWSGNADSYIYEIPFVNGAYPAPYQLSGPVPACGANPTTVCSWGNFTGSETGYGYVPALVAVDGFGTGYMVASQAGVANPTNTIFACNTLCAAGTKGTNDAIVLAANLPNAVVSMVGDFAGDLFIADGSANVWEIPANAAAPATPVPATPVAVSSSFTSTLGVAVDAGGNLFVTDIGGVYEIPRGTGTYTASPILISAINAGSAVAAGGGVDAHGNFYLPWAGTNLTKLNIDNGVFAPAAVSSPGAPITFNVTFSAPVASVTATSAGPEAPEFVLSGSTCASGGVAGGSCTFTGTFTPSGVGIRKGAILVSDGAGNQTQVLVSGVGNGAALNIDPGTQTQIGKGYSAAAGVAVDAAGNVFLADTGANAVYEYAGGAGTAVPIGTGLVSPTGVAVDGAGDVFIGDRGGSGSAKGRVVEVPIVSGALTNSRQSVVASGLGTPQGIFVDGTGTLYIADSANKNVLAVAPGQFGEAAAGLSFGTGLTTPSDVSVDNAGNLYIADAGTNQVLQISPEGVQSWFGTGLNAPSGVAAEPGGSIIVADQGNGRIVRIPSQAGTLNGAAQQILESSFASPHSVRLDGAGDLVVADNLANAVESLNRTAISAAFGTVKTGTTSTDQAITLSSTGNADLGLGSPLFTPLTGDFSLIQGATPCADGSTLKMGAVCDLEASFTPSTGTAESLTVDFSTLALNAAAYSVTLTGTGSSTSTPTLTVSTSLPSIAASQVLQLTVGVSGGTGNPAVTGAITVTSGSYASAPATITAGSAKITIPAGSLAVGSDTLTVSYTPDSAAASTYNGASTTVLLAVSPAGATAPVMTVSLSSTTLTTLQQLTATVGLSDGQGNPIPTGSVSLTSGSFTSTAVPLSSGSASISVQGALLALGSDLLTITYTPDSASSSIYTSVSQSDSVTVNPVPSFTLSNGGLIIVAPGATTGNTSAITVTPTYGFTGAVNLTCTVTTTAANPTDAATCALGTGASSATASVTISGATAATTTLSVKTTAASAKSTNPLKDFFLGGGGISLAGLLVFGFSFRRRNRGMLLGILLLAVVSGLVVGCSSSNGKQIPGTTVGNYTVTVTGTDAATGQLTSSTAVNVTVD